MIKRFKKIIMSLVVVSILLFGFQGVSCNMVYGATKVTSSYLSKVKKAYYIKINDLVGVDEFALKDLNGDGVPELIVQDYNIYTYVDGKVKVLGAYDAGNYIIAYYPDFNTLQIQYEHMGIGCINYYDCFEETMNLAATYYYYNDSEESSDIDIPSYELYGETVEEQEFTDYDNMLGNGQSIKFYKATKSNLSKYLYHVKTYTYKDLGISTDETAHKIIYITDVSQTALKYKKAYIDGEEIKVSGKTLIISSISSLKFYVINKPLVNYKLVKLSTDLIKKNTYWIPLYENNKLIGLAQQYTP